MKSYSVTSDKLQNLTCFSWVSTDTAVAASFTDRCLYEVVLNPNLQGVRASKISQPFPASILSIVSLIPGCGSSPSSASNAPTSQANQKSPFQLSRASGQSSDFGQTIICVGCADGTVSFLYADVVQLGGQGQRINIRRQKTHNLKEFIQSADDVMPVTAMCLMQPRGSILVVATETGYLCTFSLTSGQFSFKQLLRSDVLSPIHTVISLNKSHIAFTFKNQLQVISINRPNTPEMVYKVQENSSVTSLACNSQILCIGAEHQGVVFYDLQQNLEVSTFPPPLSDAISSVSTNPTSEEFICSTRKGTIMVFRKNGVLREISHTSESISQESHHQFPGGINEISYAPYGAVFFSLCHSGFCYGVVFPPRVSCGNYTFEPVTETQIRVIDNVLGVNDLYHLPEPLTFLTISNNSQTPVVIGATCTSVIVWTPPSTQRALELRGNGVSATLKNQWIQEPLRSQTFTEQMKNFQVIQNDDQKSSIQTQIVGGVQFGVFNFEKTEEQAAKAALQQDFSPVCKSALYLRHSVQFAKASNKYLLLQDVSGEAHVCQLSNLGLVHTFYNGQICSDQLEFTDEIVAFTEGPVLRITETGSGNYIIKQLVHQRKLLQVAISCFLQEQNDQNSGKINIQLGNIFGGIVGAQTQSSEHSEKQVQKSNIIISLLDSSSAVFVTQLYSAAFYQKFTQTSQVFNQLNIQTKALSILFPQQSNILTILTIDSPNLPPPQQYLGTADNPDYNTRLRCMLYAQPVSADISLVPTIFVSPVAVSLTQLLRSCAQMSFEETVDNSSRQIQQFKLLVRQTAYKISRVSTTVRTAQSVSASVNITSCCVNLLGGSSYVIVPLPEFPFLVEQFQKDSQITQRLCRYVQQPALWSLLCHYCKQQNDSAALKLSLAAVGQIPKAIYEADANSVELLLDQGKIGKAVQQCCDLWDFEHGRQIISKDRRFGPLLIYLRRQLFRELGSIADEKNEPWLSLVNEFGDKAVESSLQLIEK